MGEMGYRDALFRNFDTANRNFFFPVSLRTPSIDALLGGPRELEYALGRFEIPRPADLASVVRK